MAKCDVKIKLDKREVYSNETITATLNVLGNSDFTCNAITLDLIYIGHGRGNLKVVRVERKQLYKGEISAGEHLTFSTEFVIPEAPLTYHGKYLNVDWYIKANVDVSWAFDPKCKEDFIVLPSPTAKAPDPVETVQNFDGRLSTGAKIGLGCLLFFIVPTSFGLFFSIVGAVLGEPNLLIGSAVLFIMLLGFLFIGYMMVRNYIAIKSIGRVDLKLDRDSYFPGMVVKGKICFLPTKRMHINSIDISIKAEEVVVRGSGTDKVTHRHVLLNQKVVKLPPFNTFNREEVDIPFEVELPDEPYYSVSMTDNSLKWSIISHIDIANWPDFSKHWNFRLRG